MSSLSCCKLTVISTCTGLRRSHSHNFDSLHRAMRACMSALYMAASIVKCRFWPFYLQLWANIHTTQVRSALITDYPPCDHFLCYSLDICAPSPASCQTPLLRLLPFTHSLLAAGHSAVSGGRRLICGLIRRHQQLLTLLSPVCYPTKASQAHLHEVWGTMSPSHPKLLLNQLIGGFKKGVCVCVYYFLICRLNVYSV